MSTTARFLVNATLSGATSLAPYAARELLGEAGVADAMRRAWLQPCMETGRLLIAPYAAARGSLNEAALSEVIDPNSEETDVGDEVVVADQGKPVAATVAGKNPDGTLRLSFKAGAKPAKDTFKKLDMRLQKKYKPLPGS